MNLFFEPTVLATETHWESVRRCAKIILERFNFNNFYYYRITNDGNFFLYDDNTDVIRFLGDQDFHLKHVYYCHPRYRKSELKIEITRENPFLVQMEETRRFFEQSEFNLFFQISQKSETAVDEFGFHSDNATDTQARFILNHVGELKLFLNWFLKSHSRMFDFLRESALHLPSILGDTFYENRILGLDPDSQIRALILKDLGFEFADNLSSGEQEVLRLTKKGYTPAQIGSRVFRSKRSIEHRIESLKSKLSCDSKVELIERCEQLELAGYL